MGITHIGGGREVLDPFDDISRHPFSHAGGIRADDQAHAQVVRGFLQRLPVAFLWS